MAAIDVSPAPAPPHVVSSWAKARLSRTLRSIGVSIARKGLVLVGVLLLAVGVGAIAWPLLWWHTQRVQGEHAIVRLAHDACSPQAHGTGGILAIPSLGVVAPVEQGLGDATLAVAVGHDPATPWPGNEGMSVLAAHDVSYFARNAQLEPGATIIYQTACTSYDFRVADRLILHPGERIPPVGPIALALDSCWPSNALFLTPDRLIITARLTATHRRPQPLTAVRLPSVPNLPNGVPTPPNLFDIGWLAGTLSLSGSPSPGWRTSPAPLDWESAALAALSAYREGRALSAPWTARLLAPTAGELSLLDAPYDSGTPVDVSEDVRGDHVLSVTIEATLGGVRSAIVESPIGGSLRISSVAPIAAQA